MGMPSTYSMTRMFSRHSSGYTFGHAMKATSLFSSANSCKLAASRLKSVSSRNVAHSSSTTSRKSSICPSLMNRDACRATIRMMSISCAMVARTPGRWIFTATTLPSARRALCTCAKEALPSGLGSISAKIFSRSSP